MGEVLISSPELTGIVAVRKDKGLHHRPAWRNRRLSQRLWFSCRKKLTGSAASPRQKSDSDLLVVKRIRSEIDEDMDLPALTMWRSGGLAFFGRRKFLLRNSLLPKSESAPFIEKGPHLSL